MSSQLYPLARRDEGISDDFHGRRVKDPYRWLEDPDAPETAAFVDELNRISVPFLDGCTLKEQINKRLTELIDYPKYSCPVRRGDYYFSSYNSGLQNQSVFYIQKDVKDSGRVFMDPNQWSEDGTTAIKQKSFTNDGTLLAYGVSEKGSDWTTIKFKKVPSGEDLPDVIKNVKFSSISWTKDNSGVFYNMFPSQASDDSHAGTKADKHEHHSLFYHRLGTPQSDDVMVVHFKDNPEYMVHAEVTEEGRYCVVSVDKGCDPHNLLFFADLEKENLKGPLNLKPIVGEFNAKYEYIENFGSTFILQTDDEAPMYKLVTLDVDKPAKKNWKSLIAEKSEAKLDWCFVADQDKLVVAYLKDVKNELHVFDAKTGAHLYQIPVEVGTIGAASGRKEYSEIFFQFVSFTTPGRFYRLDLRSTERNPEVIREIAVKGYDSSLYETEQVFYPSKDGTKVPMFIFRRKGFKRDGDNPVILYGYGGFDISLLPYFSASRLLFLEHFGGAYAVANLRGGSEYGKSWHEAGMKEKKQNVFDDLIYAARYLVDNKYTKSSRLAIQGGSNGGLVVAACAQQEPSLFGAVVNQVGVNDMLRYHKFTIGKIGKSVV